MARETIRDVTTALCGALTDLKCQYTCAFDNRGGTRSAYVHVTRPVPAKIRIADHKSSRIEKDKGRSKILVIDVGIGEGRGISWQEAVSQIAATILDTSP